MWVFIVQQIRNMIGIGTLNLSAECFIFIPPVQTARVNILDASFPGLQGFTGNKLWTEEWYEFGPEKISGLNYILAVDESTYNPKVHWGEKKGAGMGKLHPVAWYHNFDGGRVFLYGTWSYSR